MQTQAEYVEENNGTKCPKCSSPNINAEEFDPETLNIDISCEECEHEWTEIYKLVGYEKKGGGS